MPNHSEMPERAWFDAWERPDFELVLRQMLEERALALLGIERATTHGGQLAPEGIALSVLRMEDDGNLRRVKVAVFFTESVGGCNCADDPFTVNGYCERWVILERFTHGIQVSDVD
jgi:hypothetical protein